MTDVEPLSDQEIEKVRNWVNSLEGWPAADTEEYDMISRLLATIDQIKANYDEEMWTAYG